MMSEKIIVPTPTTKKVKDYALNTTKILYISLVLILLYIPIVFIIILSFNKNLLGTSFEGFTFQWYQKMLEKKNLKEAIINTLSISFFSTIISTVGGTLFAIGINSLSKGKRKAIIMLNNIPILNADIVSGVFLFIVFKTIGSILGNQYPLGYFTLLLSHIFFSLPYVVLSVLPKLNEIDNNLYDAALDLGCKPRSALWKVIVPAISGGIFSGAVLALTMSIDDFTISYFVSGADVQNLSIWIYSSSGNARFGNIQCAYAFYSIITIVLFGSLLAYNVIVKKKNQRLKNGGNNK